MLYWIKRGAMLVAGLAVLAVVNGLAQPLQTHVTRQDIAPGDYDYAHVPGEDGFVGIAFSGGGARAAAFAAAGMIALMQKHLPQDEITHMSSVSGGGFTNAYLALNPPQGCTGPQDRAGCDAYLDAMLRNVAPRSFAGIDARQILFPWRVLSPSRRLTSLTEELDRPRFLGGKTFDDLPTDRAIFFNAVSYDTGRPFVFSNAALPHEHMTGVPGLPSALRSSSFSTKDSPRPTPGGLNVSLAVATSAAFPPYMGPTTIEAPGEEMFWHLGDGGIVENTGRATLIEALHASGQTSARLFVFDASAALDSQTSLKARDISIFSQEFTRIVDVLNVYGATYRTSAFGQLETAAAFNITEHRFSYAEFVRDVTKPDAPKKWRNWTTGDWPACRDTGDTPAQRLATIPTRYTITRCNRDLITTAAQDMVNQRFH